MRNLLAIILIGVLLTAGCASKVEVQTPRVEVNKLEFVKLNDATLQSTSVLTVMPMERDVGNLASLLELALATKYKVISSTANRRVTTETNTQNGKRTELGTVQSKASHAVKISYSPLAEYGRFFGAERFTAQIIRINDGNIDGVIRINQNSRSDWMHSDEAEKDFGKVVNTMP